MVSRETVERTILAARALGDVAAYNQKSVLDLLVSYQMAMEALAEITARPNKEAIDAAKGLVEASGWRLMYEAE